MLPKRVAQRDFCIGCRGLISLKESQELDQLAGALYDLLPGSGNLHLSFPTVAAELSLEEYWIGGSKRPAIVTLLTATYERERHRFCPLIEGVVRKALSWRASKARQPFGMRSRGC
jgi:hypothetical protein